MISVVPANRASWEDRRRTQTECGHPESGTTSGLVAYLDGAPVGWCAVEPRPGFTGVSRPTVRRAVMRIDF